MCPQEAPVNVSLGPGQNYNPYFPGGKIAMARPLQDGQVEYDDGTPATTSQMAKDVTIFLNWAAEPEHDLRKKMGMQVIISTAAPSCFVRSHTTRSHALSIAHHGDRIYHLGRIRMQLRLTECACCSGAPC